MKSFLNHRAAPVLEARIASVPPKGGGKIRLLLLEDRISDVDLILRELRRSGFDPDCRRVDCEADFLVELDPAIDLILADYTLPLFDGMAALRCMQKRGLDIPFIIVTGSLGDERAAQCIKEGVCDYLLKDRLERLGLAVTHALEERRLRQERIVVEEQLRQAQKMEAVGRLIGGVAHDFNNVLTVIKGYLGLVLNCHELNPEVREALDQVSAAGDRAESLTRQLLIFCRKKSIEPRTIQLNDAIAQVVAMLRRLIGENIDLEVTLAPGLPPIEADTGMMEQVLVNLAVNARDAMTEGGKIKIRTDRVQLAGESLREQPNGRPGTFACLSVEDSGTGIDPAILPRIFEPFFTTKEVGKGTGLGLANIFGIVQLHNGWVDVTSQLGKGTRFRIFLPTVESAMTGKAFDARQP